METAPSILITIDVEDWFQVENFKPWIPAASWPDQECRLEPNIRRLLKLLSGRRATFFVLGWVAKRMPGLIREMHGQGHEIASHGLDHNLCSQLSRKALKQDLIDSRHLLEDITGAPVAGFRAPSFAIDRDILNVIEEAGYRYDSSYNSFAFHGRYGRLQLPENRRSGIAYRLSADFWEVPVSNLKVAGTVLPLAGGGYFRLLPYVVFKKGVKAVLQKDWVYVFYLHPWEIDSKQPRVRQARWNYRFRHYVNLKRTHCKLIRLTRDFGACRFLSCMDYVELLGNGGSAPATSQKISPYIKDLSCHASAYNFAAQG